MYLSVCTLLVLLLALSLCEAKKTTKPKKSSNEFEKGENLLSEEENRKRMKNKRVMEEVNKQDDSLDLDALASEELGLKEDHLRAALHHGENSKQAASALNALGRNIYRQGRLEDALKITKKMLEIFYELEGTESQMVASTLGNLAGVMHKLEKFEECRMAAYRVLYILLSKENSNKDGSPVDMSSAESKAVLLHRGRMMQFGVEDAEDSAGMSHKKYVAYERKRAAKSAHTEDDAKLWL